MPTPLSYVAFSPRGFATRGHYVWANSALIAAGAPADWNGVTVAMALSGFDAQAPAPGWSTVYDLGFLQAAAPVRAAGIAALRADGVLSAASGAPAGLSFSRTAAEWTTAQSIQLVLDPQAVPVLAIDGFQDVRLRLATPAAATPAPVSLRIDNAAHGQIDAAAAAVADIVLTLATPAPTAGADTAFLVRAGDAGGTLAVGRGDVALADTSGARALLIFTGGAGDDVVNLSAANGAGGTLAASILLLGANHGGFTASGQVAIGYGADYTASAHDQLAAWFAQGAELAGFRVTGRVNVGGPAGTERDYTIASAAGIPPAKAPLGARGAMGNGGMFSAYADFYVTPYVAAAWHLTPLAGQTLANLLDNSFHAGNDPTKPFDAFPRTPGIGLVQPDVWETAGGWDSTNFELNGNYTDWFSPAAPHALHDELVFAWTGDAIAASVQLSLLQTGLAKAATVQLYHRGSLVYAGVPPPIDATGGFGPGNPAVATLNLGDFHDAAANPLHLLFDEIRIRAAGGGFLVNGLSVTLAANTTTPIGGDRVILSADPAAGPASILYNAPPLPGFGRGPSATGGDGVQTITNFDLARGDQLAILKTDLVHLQFVPTNAGPNGMADLAVRFLDNPTGLILLSGLGGIDTASAFHTLTQGGLTEVVLGAHPVFV